MGVRGVASRFRFREGITSSMSNGSADSSFLTGPLWANREREVRVLRRGERDLAFKSFEVSWEILEVRILEGGMGHLQVQCVDVDWRWRCKMGIRLF